MDIPRSFTLLFWVVLLLGCVGVFFVIGIESGFLNVPIWLVAVVVLPMVVMGIGLGGYVIVSCLHGFVEDHVNEAVQEALRKRDAADRAGGRPE